MAKTKPSRSTKKSTEEIPKVGVTLESCQAVGFSLALPNDNPDGKSIGFATTINFSGEPKDGKMLVGLTINGAIEADSGEPETVISLLTMTVFSIDNASYLEMGESGTAIIPGWIIATVVSVALGTTRGILLEKLANTIYKDVILPILGLNQFLPKSPENERANHGI